MHLRFSVITAEYCNESRHPQAVMRELGIVYQHATPQTLGDQWWFWNCVDIPARLPEYLTPLRLDPHQCIGFGLTEEDANKIAAWESTQSNNKETEWTGT
jgi:hypothetical protein